jgi:hypothetical protein
MQNYVYRWLHWIVQTVISFLNAETVIGISALYFISKLKYFLNKFQCLLLLYLLMAVLLSFV